MNNKYISIHLKKRYASRVRYYIVWFANNVGLYAFRKKGCFSVIRIPTNNLSGKGYAVVLNVAIW